MYISDTLESQVLLSGNNGLEFLLVSVYMQVSQHKNFMWECGIDHPMIEKQLKIHLSLDVRVFSTFVVLGDFNIDFLNQDHPLFSKQLRSNSSGLVPYSCVSQRKRNTY